MNKKEQIVNFSFVLPALIIFSIFWLAPFYLVFELSLSRTNPKNILATTFVGAENFINIFSAPIFTSLTLILGIALIFFAFTSKIKQISFKNQKINLSKFFQVIFIGLGILLLFYSIFKFINISQNPFSFDPDQRWWKSVGRSFYIAIWALTFQNCLAFLLALAVDRAIRAGKIYRVIFFLLPILGEVIIGLLLRKLLNNPPDAMNNFLISIGLENWAQNWIGPKLAMTTLAISHCWRSFGYGFIILLAGLQTIPEQLYEAARIDGANAFHRFTKITVPMLIPVISLVIILTILGTVQIIGLPMAFTRGAPAGKTTVAVLKIYNDLENHYLGYASAEGLILGVILILLSFSLLKISKKLKS